MKSCHGLFWSSLSEIRAPFQKAGLVKTRSKLSLRSDELWVCNPGNLRCEPNLLGRSLGSTNAEFPSDFLSVIDVTTDLCTLWIYPQHRTKSISYTVLYNFIKLISEQ